MSLEYLHRISPLIDINKYIIILIIDINKYLSSETIICNYFTPAI